MVQIGTYTEICFSLLLLLLLRCTTSYLLIKRGITCSEQQHTQIYININEGKYDEVSTYRSHITLLQEKQCYLCMCMELERENNAVAINKRQKKVAEVDCDHPIARLRPFTCRKCYHRHGKPASDCDSDRTIAKGGQLGEKKFHDESSDKFVQEV